MFTQINLQHVLKKSALSTHDLRLITLLTILFCFANLEVALLLRYSDDDDDHHELAS